VKVDPKSNEDSKKQTLEEVKSESTAVERPYKTIIFNPHKPAIGRQVTNEDGFK
jgi:hypothetical protein